MKIVVAHNFYQQSGGEDTVFAQEVDLLRDAGHDVVTYTRSNKEIEQYGILDKALLVPRTIWSTRTQSAFGELLDRERPDLVHFHNTFMMMSPSVYAACKDRNIPVVQTLHNFRLTCPGGAFFRDGAPCEDCATKGLWNGIRHKCYRNSRMATTTVTAMIAINRATGTWRNLVDCYIALTMFAKDRMASSGIPSDKIHIKPNFVSPDPGPRTRAADYALHFGRLVVEKGSNTLLSAWKVLDGSIPLRVIGDGPQRKNMEARCISEGIRNVSMLGHLPRTEVMAHVRGAHFIVIPSECYENFPMTIAEAFACGVPVIASNIGSTAEIVHNEITGLTFKPGDAGDLARCVRWAIDHPEEMDAMGRRARAEFEQKYSAATNYEILMSIYAKAMKAERVAEPIPIPEVA